MVPQPAPHRSPRRWQRGIQWALMLLAAILLVVVVRSYRLQRAREGDALASFLARGAGTRVTAIELERPGEQIRVTADAGQWRLEAPLADLASRRMVGECLRALESLDVLRLLPDAELAPFELDPPRVRMTLTLRNGEQRAIRLGATAPASGQIYAHWDGLAGVAIIPRFIAHQFFLNDLFFWREREILPSVRAPIDSVWVDAGGPRIRAQRHRLESWSFLAPRDREADGVALERTVAGFWRFQYNAFFDDPAQWPFLGLDPPLARWIVFRGGRIDTLRIGRRLDNGAMAVQLAGRPPGRMRDDLFEFFTGGLAALEVRRFLRPDSVGIVRLLVTDGERGRCWARTAQWLTGPAPAESLGVWEAGRLPWRETSALLPARDPAIEQEIANLFVLAGERWAEPLAAPAAADHYDLRIHLWDRDGQHAWIYFTPTPAGGAPEEAAYGTAVGTRFPRRPMTVAAESLERWRRRLRAAP